LEVPIPELVGGGAKRRYQIHLKSSDGQIYVLLVNKDPDSEQPVVVQVPPPKEVADAIEKASENLDEVTSSSRVAGRKAKATGSPTAAAGSDGELVSTLVKKKQKFSSEESEVEAILSGKVLDTDIPGLEEFMSTESKYLEQSDP
jgi:hypothetical protein